MTRRTTAQRGYGTEHRKERERRLAIYRPGDICAHGGEPLAYWPLAYARQYLDLPHNADRTGYLPGLSCRRHNRIDGAVRGNVMRGKRRQRQAAPAAVAVTQWQASRDW
jgi:hypothetical protein